eukprot:s559_g7.t1
MQCSRCSSKRCSFDFPEPLSKCKHPPSVCLTCLDELRPIDSVPGKCLECDEILSVEDVEKIRSSMKHGNRECAIFHELDLQRERGEQARSQRELDVFSNQPEEGTIQVALADGIRHTLCGKVKPQKFESSRQFHGGCGSARSRGKQRLFFRGQDLSANCDESDPRWGSVGVPFGQVIQLVIVMYETGPNASVRKLSFELGWTPPCSRKPHHLNGTCIALDSRGHVLANVDFQSRYFSGVAHGGRSHRFNPRQLVTVDTDVLPSECHYLFFALSAYAPHYGMNVATLSSFEDPTVHLKNADSLEMLASYQPSRRSADQEAIVLCCAAKDKASDDWRVQQIGVPSAGNWRSYGPLHSTVSQMVFDGQVF